MHPSTPIIMTQSVNPLSRNYFSTCEGLTSSVYMTIIMTMNIYITKSNTEFLRSVSAPMTMSGLINGLLEDYRIREGLSMAYDSKKKELRGKPIGDLLITEPTKTPEVHRLHVSQQSPITQPVIKIKAEAQKAVGLTPQQEMRRRMGL